VVAKVDQRDVVKVFVSLPWSVTKAGSSIFKIIVVTKWMNHSIQYTFDATSIFYWKYSDTSTISPSVLTPSIVYSIDKPSLTAMIIDKGVQVRGIGSN